MSLSLGGLGFMSLRNPFSELVSIFLGKGDLRSMFCLIVFLIVSLVLAYLTNPNENSFRAYLTEQSFRHHLSRLDENADDPHSVNTYRSRYAPRNSTWSSAHNITTDNAPPFHFANRASIALRTPKHVFHSFAIFTIAAMVPLSKSSEGDNREGWMISDSWYIGAFGKWWRGGVLEAWYQDVIARSKDEESWSSGILNMKRLDMLQDYNGPTFTAKNLPANLSRGSPPKLRNRERPTPRHTAVQPRSSTPPPLPKSATLPMHATRKILTNGDRITDRSSQVQHQPHVQPSLSADASRHGSSVSRSSSSTSFEHSPIIAEVLRQISSAKASVLDLRNQLSECETHSSQTHAVLQHEVDAHRERKRQEDCNKLEIKVRTKSLEDSKRSAETLKKEADKKLKMAQLFHDNAIQRIQYLDKGIAELQQSLSADQQFIVNHQSEVSEVEREISENLERKRQEIKNAEDLLVVLNQRSRELEEKVASEKERLASIRDETNNLQHNQASLSHYSPHMLQQSEGWISNARHRTGQPPASIIVQNGEGWDMIPDHWNQPTLHEDLQYAPDHLLNLTSSPNVVVRNATMEHKPSAFNMFLPFADVALDAQLPMRSNSTSAESPEIAHSHGIRAKDIPSNGHVTPMESNISRSFQSDSDPYIDREWRSSGSSYPSHFQDDSLDSHFAITSSPSSLHGNSLNTPEDNSFENRIIPAHDYDRQVFDSPIDMQAPSWIPEMNTLLEPQGTDYHFLANMDQEKSSNRWFSALGREKTRGLNPDAKEFNLFRKPRATLFAEHSHLPTSSYDALNPNGLGSALAPSASSNSQSLLRAFAPSPAEREALQRALGGSTNTSFERLPSLSDVGSIPASPTSTHAHVHAHVPQHPGRALGSLLPAWLQSLPRARKVKFSPWDDEEPAKEEATKEITA